jgi:hypothetical protein
MDAHDSVRDKTWRIFDEAFGSRADLFKGGVPARTANDVLGDALAKDVDPLVADQIAFHMVDWEIDAAFLVAFLLFPERFTKEELQAATEMFLIHVPAHVMAAGRLAGHDVKDIFKDEDAT